METATPSPDLYSLRGFERVHRLYYRYVWTVLANLGVPDALIDDAHQEVFITCYRRRDSFEAGRPIKPWLVGIARKVAFRYRRSQQRQRRKLSELGSERDLRNNNDPRGKIEARLLLEKVIEHLDPPRREVFILGELEGRTGPEIASELGIHLEAAYSRLRSARAAMMRVFVALDEPPATRAEARPAFALLLPQIKGGGGALAWIGAWSAKAKAGAAIAGLATVTATALVVDEVRSPREDSAALSRSSEQVRRGRGEGGVSAGVGSADDTTADVAAIEPPPPATPTSADETSASLAPQRPRGKAFTSAPGPVAGGAEEDGGSAESSAEIKGQMEGEIQGEIEGELEGAPSDLGREARLLARAKEALNAGSPEQALAHLRDHTLSFPDGSLREARSALRIESLCVLGRVREARGEAAALRRDYPDSSVARRLTDPCARS